MKSFRSSQVAVASLLLMLVGSVGIPTLHLVFHSLPHDHIGGGIHYHLFEETSPAAQAPVAAASAVADDDDDDGHDEIPHHHHHHHRVAKVAESASGHTHDDHHHGDREPFDPRHGEGSNAHFSLALAAHAAASIALTVARPHPVLNLPAQRLKAPRSAERATTLVRGPPAIGV